MAVHVQQVEDEIRTPAQDEHCKQPIDKEQYVSATTEEKRLDKSMEVIHQDPWVRFYRLAEKGSLETLAHCSFHPIEAYRTQFFPSP